MDQEAVQRIERKSAQEAIISRIGADLRLTPFLARAYYEQMAEYFRLCSNLDVHDNQVAYGAVAAEEPSGKKLCECQRVSVRLTLHEPADLQSSSSISSLRRKRIARVCQEALDQGGLLTQEDLAILLTASPSTIERDLRALREQGLAVPTRGRQRDIGPAISHKVQTIERYLPGESLASVAGELGIHYETARKWWRIGRRCGRDHLAERPRKRPGLLRDVPQAVADRVVFLREEHRDSWGNTP